MTGDAGGCAQKWLGKDGLIARRLGPGFEPRPQQIEMVSAIERAMESRSTLLVEAGTGVGKSFAYLAPAIERIVARGERVIVATNTIALQEQLVNKDVPTVLSALQESGGPEIKAELVKGRGNYVSIRRLMLASKRQDRLFTSKAARDSLHVIEDWAYTTEDGSLATLPAIERMSVWDKVQSDSGNCMGRKCPMHDRCFYQRARQRMTRADLLICNHALFFSDLALRARGVGFLPYCEHVILDEAHHIEDIASEHFGLSLTEGRVMHLLNSLYAPSSHRGYLASLVTADKDEAALIDQTTRTVLEAHDESARFFGSLRARVRGVGGAGSIRVGPGDAIEDSVSEVMARIALGLRRLREFELPEEDRFELNAFAERADSISTEARMLCMQELPGCVYWIESGGGDGGSGPGGSGGRTAFECSPIDVAPVLREHLFTGDRSVVLTSATLASGGRSGEPSFAHVVSRLGCEDAETLALGSPFDHAAQAELHVDPTMPDPRSSEYLDALASRIASHIRATQGGAFVLFTSFRTMNDVADVLRGGLEAAGHPVFVQGRDGSRSLILDRFRLDDRSVLFGTSSFWQGVDVKGRGLRNVIITRLPFDPPDRPITQARLEAIEARGGNPFMEDSLPRAVIRFRQGFGRLIRSASDRGRVVVLDPRIATARYGRLFSEALPPGVRVIGPEGELLGAP
ncbi:MAG: DEAD/DEAH box helicase [Phycisphaerales bacterium]|nr:DEAD/DEAH box helicase [Phycisphaerales bacterium]